MQYIDIVDGYEGFELKIPRWGFARAKQGLLMPATSQEKRPAEAGRFSWLGMRDSNPRMSAPKADALPLGESPTDSISRYFSYSWKELNYFTIFRQDC